MNEAERIEYEYYKEEFNQIMEDEDCPWPDSNWYSTDSE